MRKGASGIDLIVVLAIGFVVAAVTISVGASVVSTIASSMGNVTEGYNPVAFQAASNGTIALANISTNMPLLGTIGALVIVIVFITMLKGRSE